jgi:hypothetical protein
MSLGRRSTAARGRMGRPRRAHRRSTRSPSRQHVPQRIATRTTTPPALSLARPPLVMPSLSAPPVQPEQL